MKILNRTCSILALVIIIPSALLFYQYNIDTNKPMTTDVYGRHVLNICNQTIFGELKPDGEIDSNRRYYSACATGLTRLFDQYVMMNNNVYWMEQRAYDHSPCISGTGDTTALFYNLSWECFTAKPRQINKIEDRDLHLVTGWSPSFQPLKNTAEGLQEWQQQQFAQYAKNESAVYFKGKRIEGASPTQFSVTYPFGNDEKWEIFSIATSNGLQFINGHLSENIDLRHFRPLEPVRCPGHGLSKCSAYYEAGMFFKYGSWQKIIPGIVGNDIILLQKETIWRFPDMASADTFVFAAQSTIYFYSKGAFYQLADDANGGKKLIDMDRSAFENAP